MNNIPKELAIYQTDNGEIKLKEDVENETIWASKKDIAHIYGIDRSMVSRHINKLFKSEELDKNEVCALFAQTTKAVVSNFGVYPLPLK
jgi:hypothetical protein